MSRRRRAASLARRARVTLAVCVMWLLLPGGALRAADVRAAVELFLNDTSCGDVIILLRDGTPWVPIETLRAAGLRVDRGTRAWVGDGGDNQTSRARLEYVALATLAEAMAYRFDEQELQLRLTARPDQFLAQVFPVRTGAPPDVVRTRNSSAFLNYAAFAESHGATVATDAGISLRGALLRFGGGRDTIGRFFRTPARLTIDNTSRLVRWDVGDSIAMGGLIAGTLPVLGASVSRESASIPISCATRRSRSPDPPRRPRWRRFTSTDNSCIASASRRARSP